MAHNSAKQPLLSGLIDPSAQPEQMNIAKPRRFRRCISTPVTDSLLPERKNSPLNPVTESFLHKFKPSFRQVAILLVLYLGVGTFCFFIIANHIKGKRSNGVVDALYFCIVTMTTVGYGDLVPYSTLAKLLACAFVFTGMALIGLALSRAADYIVEKQEILLVRALNIRHHIGPTEIIKEVETNKVKYKLATVTLLLVLLMTVGTIFLFAVEKLDLVDAFYCVCSTITTLGYGDESFSTKGGRIFAIFWILTSTICLAQFYLYVAEINTENRQKSLVKWVLTRKMTSLDLEVADMDGDGVLSAAEFIIYKLKEMGKISQEDIALVMKEFKDLDVDQSGTVSASDLALVQ